MTSLSPNPITSGCLEGMIPHKFPIVPGWEMAGEVMEVGTKVKGLQVRKAHETGPRVLG